MNKYIIQLTEGIDITGPNSDDHPGIYPVLNLLLPVVIGEVVPGEGLAEGKEEVL